MTIINATVGEPMGGVTGWIIGVMEALDGPGAGLAVAAENLFPPIPSEVILPLAGFTASRGDMNVLAAIVWTTVGSVLGALALYWIGALIGRHRIRAIAAWLPLIDVADIDKTEAWFTRHGVQSVFFGRMIPIFRGLISIPAGVERMPLATFLTFTALGSLIWNTLFILAGYLLGESWPVVQEYAGIFQNVVIAVVALAVAYFLFTRVRRARRGRHRPAPPRRR